MHIVIPIAFLLFPIIVGAQPASKDTTQPPPTPGFTLQNPLNPGTFGTVVVAIAIQEKTRLARQADGNAEVYLGLGYPEKSIGGGTTINVHGLTNNKGEKNNLGEGTASFHLNKLILKNKLLVDAGVDNLFSWGGRKEYRNYITYQKSFYVAANYFLKIGPHEKHSFSYVSLTAGAGNGYYRKDKDYTPFSSGQLNPFLSAATPVFPNTTFIGEWNGYDAGVGLSSFPFKRVPLLFCTSVTDLVYGTPRYIFSLSLALQFSKHAVYQRDRPLGAKMIRPARTI